MATASEPPSGDWFEPFKGRLGEALAKQIFKPLPKLKAPYEATFPDELWENPVVQRIPIVKAFVSAGATGTPEDRWFVRKTLAFLEAAQTKGTRGGEWDRFRARLRRDSAFRAEATRYLVDSLECYDSVNKAATLGSFLRTFGEQGVEDINRESRAFQIFGEQCIDHIDWNGFVAWASSIQDPPQTPPSKGLPERKALPPSYVPIKREGWFRISAPTLLLNSFDQSSGQMEMAAVAISDHRQMLDIFEREVVRELRALEGIVLDELTSTESKHFLAAMEGIQQARGMFANDPKWARKLASEEAARKDLMFSESARSSYMDEINGLSNYARAVRLCNYPLGNLAAVTTPALLSLNEFQPSYDEYAADLCAANRERMMRPLKVKTFKKRDRLEVEGRKLVVNKGLQTDLPDPPKLVSWLEKRGALCCRAFSLIDTMRLGLDFWGKANESGRVPDISRAANDFILRVTNLSVLLADIRHQPSLAYKKTHDCKTKGPKANSPVSRAKADEKRSAIRELFRKKRMEHPDWTAARIRNVIGKQSIAGSKPPSRSVVYRDTQDLE